MSSRVTCPYVPSEGIGGERHSLPHTNPGSSTGPDFQDFRDGVKAVFFQAEKTTFLLAATDNLAGRCHAAERHRKNASNDQPLYERHAAH